MQPKDIKSLPTILDTMKPDWWIEYATQAELAQCVRACTDRKSGTVKAENDLRAAVAQRIAQIGRAGVEWASQL